MLDVEQQQGKLMCCGSKIRDGMFVLAGRSPVYLHLNVGQSGGRLLADNGIGADGAAALAKGLKHTPLLATLDLGST